MPAQRGLGPLPWFWGLWAAAALLLATELPVAARCAAAALALQIMLWQRGAVGRSGRYGHLLLPHGGGTHWQFDGEPPLCALRLSAAGRLPGAGWLLRLDAETGSAWFWVSARRINRTAARRLRAAITAGRT